MSSTPIPQQTGDGDIITSDSPDIREDAELPEKRKLDTSESDTEEPVKRKCQFQLFPNSSAGEETAKKEIDECFELYENLSSQKADIEELRRKLKDGKFFERQMSHKFWSSLHANYGSVISYTLGFLLIVFLQYDWIIDEFGYTSEGHSVSKTVVILFLIYSYSFITLGLEAVLFAFILFEIYSLNLWERVKLKFNENGLIKKLMSFKYVYVYLSTVWCLLTAFMGTLLWSWFWWNHVCKSFHDRTCRGSGIGKSVIAYRNKYCLEEGDRSISVMCEKFISYSPIMILAVIFVFVGNVMLPLINDYLAMYLPPNQNLQAIYEIMDRLEAYQKENETKENHDDSSAELSSEDSAERDSFSPTLPTSSNDNDQTTTDLYMDANKRSELNDQSFDKNKNNESNARPKKPALTEPGLPRKVIIAALIFVLITLDVIIVSKCFFS